MTTYEDSMEALIIDLTEAFEMACFPSNKIKYSLINFSSSIIPREFQKAFDFIYIIYLM